MLSDSVSALDAFVHQWSDHAGILDLVVGILGFAITIAGLWRTASAANRAADAANQARSAMLFTNVVSDLAAAVTLTEEIKRLQRQSAWAILPDRYAELRRRLIQIRTSELLLSAEEAADIQEGLSVFAELEGKIERALMAKSHPPNPAKFNEIVSTRLDSLHVVLARLQKRSRG